MLALKIHLDAHRHHYSRAILADGTSDLTLKSLLGATMLSQPSRLLGPMQWRLEDLVDFSRAEYPAGDSNVALPVAADPATQDIVAACLGLQGLKYVDACIAAVFD